MYKKGFTLLEIIMATIILSLIMIGLVSVFVSGKKLVRHSRARMTAAELGKLFLDPLQMEVNQITWAANTSCLANENCIGTAQILDREYRVQYTVNRNTPFANVTRVKAKISWYENESP